MRKKLNANKPTPQNEARPYHDIHWGFAIFSKIPRDHLNLMIVVTEGGQKKSPTDGSEIKIVFKTCEQFYLNFRA